VARNKSRQDIGATTSQSVRTGGCSSGSFRKVLLGALQPAFEERVDDLQATVDVGHVTGVDECSRGLLGDGLGKVERKQGRCAVETSRAVGQGRQYASLGRGRAEVEPGALEALARLAVDCLQGGLPRLLICRPPSGSVLPEMVSAPRASPMPMGLPSASFHTASPHCCRKYG
jgi:hypothetical protein